MTCSKATKYLNDYLDGTLDAQKAAEVHAHVMACASCRKSLAVMQAIGSTITADRPPIRLDDAFTDMVMEKINEQAVRPMRLSRALYWGSRIAGTAAAAAAVLAIMLAAGVHMLPDMQNQQASTRTARVVANIDNSGPGMRTVVANTENIRHDEDAAVVVSDMSAAMPAIHADSRRPAALQMATTRLIADNGDRFSTIWNCSVQTVGSTTIQAAQQFLDALQDADVSDIDTTSDTRETWDSHNTVPDRRYGLPSPWQQHAEPAA